MGTKFGKFSDISNLLRVVLILLTLKISQIIYSITKFMATIKLKFRASSVAEKEGTLYYQVIHKRNVK